MPAPERAEHLTDSDWQRCEEIIERFVREWNAESPLQLERYLDGFPHRTPLLIELIHTDIELRARADLSLNLATYLAQYPIIASDPQRSAELAAAVLRQQPTQTLVARRYRIYEEIGRGSFALVYRGWDEQLGRPVAIKCARRADTEPEVADRLAWEARTMASVSHPGIVQVFDMAAEGDSIWLIQELIPGPTLSEWAKRTTPNAGSVAMVIAKVAEALQAVHDAGIVHRDVKPANVLIDSADQPRLADFGLARLANVKHSGGITGTVAYMAPEQAAGETPHFASDLYSLGAVLYELLTGSVPYPGNTLDVLRRLAFEEPVRARVRNPAVPASLEAVCVRALARKPADRYPSAAAVASDLRRFLAGQTVEAVALMARPQTNRTRILRLARIGIVLAVLLLSYDAHPTSINSLKLQPDQATDRMAELRFAAASEMIFDSVTDPTLEIGDGKPVRKRLLEKGCQELSRLLQQQDDPVIRFQRASLMDLYLGQLTRDAVMPAELEACHDASCSDWHRLAQDYPTLLAFRVGAGRAFFRRGVYQHESGRLSQAHAEFRHAESHLAYSIVNWVSESETYAFQAGVVDSPARDWLAHSLHRQHLRRIRMWVLWEAGEVAGRLGEPTLAVQRLTEASREAEWLSSMAPKESCLAARAEWHELRATTARWMNASGNRVQAQTLSRQVATDVTKDLHGPLLPLARIRPLAAVAAAARSCEESELFAEAKQLHILAAEQWTLIADARPDQPEHARQAGCEWHELGNLDRDHNPNQAIRAYQNALTIRHRLHKLHPLEIRFRLDISATAFSLGRLLAQMGQPGLAEPHLREALVELTVVCQTDPNNATFQRWQADRKRWLGRVLRELERPAEAEEIERELPSAPE